MTEQTKSILENYAEKQVNDMINENKVLVDQYHALWFTIHEMAKDKKMTNKAWRRVMKAVNESFKNKNVQENVKFEHPIEEAMFRNIRNERGLSVQLVIKNEQLLKAAVSEMEKARKLREEHMKKMQEQQIKVEKAVYEDDTAEIAAKLKAEAEQASKGE